MSKLNRLSLVFLSFLILATSCTPGKVKEQPVTDADASAFAEKLAQSIKNKQGNFFDQSIQQEIFYNRIITAAPGEPPVNMSKAELRSILKGMNLGTRIGESLGSDGTFELLRKYKADNRQHLLFRLYSEAGVNYYDFDLTKTNGKVGVTDIFVYLSGENISQTVRELMTQLAYVNKKEGNPSGGDKRRSEKMTRVRQLLETGKYKEAIDLVDDLPDSWKKIRVFMAAKLVAASRYDSDIFEKTLAEYQMYFPKDNRMELLLYDGYILQKKYNEALAGINRLDAQLGTDPVLDLLRGSLYYQQGNSDSAIWYLERLVERRPDFGDGYAQLIQVYMLNGKREKAIALFKDARANNLPDKTVQFLEENYPSLRER